MSNRGGRGGFRGNFRSNFNRGGFNNRNFNADERSGPWKDNERFENRNMGGFRGNDGHPAGGFRGNNGPPGNFRGNDGPPSGGFQGNDGTPSGGFRGNDGPPSGGFRGNDGPPSGGFRGNDGPPSGGFRGNDGPSSGGFRGNDNPSSGGFRGNDNPPSGGFRGNDGPPSGGFRGNDGAPSGGFRRNDGSSSGGFRGKGNHPRGGFNNNRDPPNENRDFGTNKDSQPASNQNSRPAAVENKRNEPPKSTPPTPAPAQPVSNNQRTNDVEIIVTHKTLTEYAEFIERRLKTVGLSVDLLFPNEEVPLGRVLGNIASRGTLYALVVTQLSEEHKSVTVNILYGQTQEHRNMPLEDAVAMIMRNFEAYAKGERTAVAPPAGAVPVNAAGIPLGEKHPEAIQSLLNILFENRPLTTPQYDKVITYLQDKRDVLVKSETSGGAVAPPKSSGVVVPSKTVDPKADLQNRILNMLSSSDTKVPSTQSHPPSLAKNSTTFKALQSMVQSNLLSSRI